MSSMRIGMSLSSTSRFDAHETPQDAARHLLDRVRATKVAGLDTMTFGDSHNRADARYFQNTPTLARALAEWDPARAAGCLFLVPMWPPVLLAEHVGTLAAFHDGPFIVQTGLGQRAQFAPFGVSIEHRGRAFDEAVRVVRALLDGETVSSEMFGIVGASVGLTPSTPIEWWFGTMTDAGIERAGRFGATWYASHGATVAMLPTRVERYLAACATSGSAPRVVLRRDAVVLADGDRARSIADDALATGYRGMSSEMVLSGTPDDIAEQLAPLAAVGVDEIMFRTLGVDPDVDLETIGLLGQVRTLLGNPATRTGRVDS